VPVQYKAWSGALVRTSLLQYFTSDCLILDNTRRCVAACDACVVRCERVLILAIYRVVFLYFIISHYSAPSGERSIAMSMSLVFACLCVSLSASISPELHVRFYQFFVHVSYDLSCLAALPITCRYRCGEWRHCVIARKLTSLLRRIGCVVS